MNTKNLILIAEDDDISYQFLSTVFTKLNLPSILAKNGEEAIEMCKSNKDISLVMMDIKMPRMDGLNATKEIKKFRPDVIIIAQTAYALNSEKAELLREGCDDYISKPIDIDVLIDLLHKYLEF